MNFKNPYNQEEYIKFFQDKFLPDDFSIENEKIRIDFKSNHINRVSYIGKVNSLDDLRIYEVNHTSENDPRVSISKDIFRIMRDYGVRNALILFVSDNSDNYRLSLATISFTLDDKNDKKVKKEYSNPRRYSFFLGPDSKTHTPEEYLIKKGKVKDSKDLLSRFSVEVVNKEFYNKIALMFTELVGGERKVGNKSISMKPLLKLPSSNDHQKMQEFAVRLIGRLVFCWFLKKKKSKNEISLIPENILSKEAVLENENYYHSILENLFFKVLNTPMNEREKFTHSELYESIPFLNGGLFEPHSDDYFEPNLINTLVIPDKWLTDFIETLETYNFTIDENTSVDIDLSVDPEMLGRIFENLLAEINPETGMTARKSTGSYYTPRPIVEYMVDESLKVYLNTKTGIDETKLSPLLSFYESDILLDEKEKLKVMNALDEVKILDPACGSGAFPIGILQKMVLILQKIDPESNLWYDKMISSIDDPVLKKDIKQKYTRNNLNFIRKFGLIQKCIYGVDIQTIAVEISKLRCFLTLIVDEENDDDKTNRGIIPLPNLEFKFVAGNTLIGLDEEAGTLFDETEHLNKLEELRNDYFTSSGKNKKKIENEFTEVQGKIVKQLAQNRIKEGKAFQLANWEPFQNNSSRWFDPKWMFGVSDGFDIVIGNPPYGVEFSDSEKKYLKNRFSKIPSKNNNSAIYFIFIASELINPFGVNSFIVPKSLTYSIGWNGCAEHIIPRLRNLIDSGKAFDNVLLEMIIYISIKNYNNINYISGFYNGENILEINSLSKKLFYKYKILLTTQSILEIKLVKKILNKFENSFGEYVSIERGLNWQKFIPIHKGKTPIYRGAQLDKYYLNPAIDFIDISKFEKTDYDYLFKPKILNQLALAHVKNPYPHFYLQSVLDLNCNLVFETISTTFLKFEELDLKFILAINNSKLFAWILYKFVFNNAIRSTRYDEQYISKIPCPSLTTINQQPFITLVDQIISKKSKGEISIELENEIDVMVYKLYELTYEEVKTVDPEFWMSEGEYENFKIK